MAVYPDDAILDFLADDKKKAAEKTARIADAMRAAGAPAGMIGRTVRGMKLSESKRTCALLHDGIRFRRERETPPSLRDLPATTRRKLRADLLAEASALAPEDRETFAASITVIFGSLGD